MKSIIEQKAELLDYFMENISYQLNCFELIQKYNAITAPPTLQADPYIDEVLPARLVNYFRECLPISEVLGCLPRVSQIAVMYPPSQLKGIRGIGTKTIHEYAEILEKYGMLEKS